LLLFSFCACENVIGCCIELEWSRGNGIRAYKTGLVFATRPGLFHNSVCILLKVSL